MKTTLIKDSIEVTLDNGQKLIVSDSTLEKYQITFQFGLDQSFYDEKQSELGADYHEEIEREACG